MMEKKQQEEQKTQEQQTSSGAGKHPGQQLPSGNPKENLDQPATTEANTRHSESSFPKNDHETLGTP